jgi:hypothetical protein
MGSPTSSIFPKISLQYLKNTIMYDILLHNITIGYFRYFDAILIVYNNTITNTQEVFDSFNDLTPSVIFTMGKELDNKFNFLDITIQKEHDTVTFSVYRKPTTTVSIIPNDSCHPQENKYAAINI